MAEVHTLSYSTLPRSREIFVRRDEDGMIVTVRTSRPKAIAAIIFVLVMMVFLTFCAVIAAVDMSWDYFGIKYVPWFYYLKPIALVIAILACWAGAILVIRMILKRGFAPTIVELTKEKIVLTTPDLSVLRHEFPIDQDLTVQAKRIGRGIDFSCCGELLIKRQDSTVLTLFRGRAFSELDWIARTLNAKLGEPKE